MPSGFLGGGIGPMALKRRAVAVAANGLLNNLIAYWPLNEAGGANNALDLHTNGLTLTQNSSPGSAAGLVYAGARTFDGSADYFSRASEALLQCGNVDFTIAMWIYWSDTSTRQFMSKDDGSANREFMLGCSAAETYLQIKSSTSHYIPIASHPSINTWHLLIAHVDNGAKKLFIEVDNAAGAETSFTGTIPATAAPFLLGKQGTPHAGRIGPVAMWKSAAGGGGVLSEAQRAALWNGGAGLAYADFTA